MQHQIAYQMQQQQYAQYLAVNGQQTPLTGTPSSNSRVSVRFSSPLLLQQAMSSSSNSSSAMSTSQQSTTQVLSRLPPSSPSKLVGSNAQSSITSSSSFTPTSSSACDQPIFDSGVDVQLKTNLCSQLVAVSNFLQSETTPDRVVVIIATTVKSISRLEKELKEKVVISQKRTQDGTMQRPASSQQLVARDKIAQIKYLTVRAFDVCLLCLSFF